MAWDIYVYIIRVAHLRKIIAGKKGNDNTSSLI